MSIAVYLSNIHYFQSLILVYLLYTCTYYLYNKLVFESQRKLKKKKTLMNENLYNSALKSGVCTSICVVEYI